MSTKKNIQPFFPHSANSRNEDNLIRLRIAHGAAGYGVYFMLMERLRQSDTYECDYDLDVLAFDLRESESLIESVINDFNLFELTDDGTKFRNKELSVQMQLMEEKRLRRQEAARKAAAARWEAVRRKEAAEQGIPYEEYIQQFVKPEYMEEQSLLTVDQPVLPGMESVSTSAPSSEQPTKTMTLDEELIEIQKDREWTAAIKKQHNLSDEEFIQLINKFATHCKCEGKKTHTDIKDAKSHFSRWIIKVQTKTETEKPKGKKSHSEDMAFRQSIATQNKIMDEQKRKRDQEDAERANIKLQNRLKIIEMGYDPDKHKIWEVMNAQWREKNPPVRKPANTPPKENII